MEVGAILDELMHKARRDPDLRRRFLETRKAEDPISAFCSLSRLLGYELYEMDLVMAGEEMYAAMKRSTNGGGENSPKLAGEDDLYELFFLELEGDPKDQS